MKQRLVSNAGILDVPARRERLEALSPDALISTVKQALDEVGIVVVRSRATRAQFFAMANRLGVVFSELAVFVDAQKQQYVRNPAAVPFHSDHHPFADIIGWYCIRPCQSGAPSIFLDVRDAYDRLSRVDRDKLLTLRLRLKAASRQLLIPVVSFNRGRPRFAWNAIWLEKPIEATAKAALRRFTKMLTGGADARTISVSLRAGEFVLIDNKRFLHGRAPLPPDSHRMLYRVWINSDSRATRLQIARPSAMGVLKRRPTGNG
jgi:Taurine catabolism dioxygenase TauD, TfdA family